MIKNNKQHEDPFEEMVSRAQELRSGGLDLHQAFHRANLEARIKNWPSAWGDDLQVLIYGDFEPPNIDLVFNQLGITVHAEELEDTVIKSAMCVLKATVSIDDKSIPALIDASRRLNTFLGLWALVSWGNAGCGWWSRITHGGPGGAIINFQQDELPRALERYKCLPKVVQKRINAALYWIREPRNLFFECHRSDVLQIYAGYWNAFECLVEAITLIHPQEKSSRSNKQKSINEFVAQRNYKLTAEDIDKCYRDIVNPGFVGKASYALRMCFGEEAQRYTDECFHLPNRDDRLYDIRNAINHGEVDTEDPLELSRIESRLTRLWMLVWRMFECLVPFPAPVEKEKGAGD